MLCSACSQIVRPVVVFDIDGTLAEYHNHLERFCREYWDLHRGPSSGWDGSGEFEDYLGLEKDQYREAKLAFRQGGQKRVMRPIEDGIRLYQHVFHLDPFIEIWVATHRPWRRLDNVDPDTQWWLDRFSIKRDHLLFSEDKYADLVAQVDKDRIVAVFEDLKPMCDRAEELGLPVAQVARPHNSAPSEIHYSRGTLGQLTYWVDAQMRAWNDKNDRSHDVQE